jgi:hypothetical protein
MTSRAISRSSITVRKNKLKRHSISPSRKNKLKRHSTIPSRKNKLKKRSIIIKKKPKLERLCDKLHKTYDTRLIDNIPDQLKVEFLKISIKCINDRYKYYPKELYTDPISNQSVYVRGQFGVLFRLLDNYFRHKRYPGIPSILKPVTRFIRGPKNLTVHWSEILNMHVYIFGEHHIQGNCTNLSESNPQNTMNIEDYLDQLLQNTDKYLDYIFEVPMIGKKKLQYISNDPSGIRIGNSPLSLNDIFQRFKVCIEPVTRHASRCRLGRVHFMDVRNENMSHMNTISYLWACFLTYKKRDIINLLNNQYFLKKLKDMHHFCNTEQKLFIYFKAFIFGINYNVAELRKLLNSEKYINKEIGLRIKKYIEDEIDVLAKKFFVPLTTNISIILSNWEQILNKKYKYWALVPSPQIKVILDSFKNVGLCLTSLVSYGPDLYTLCRMFKTFNVKKQPFVNAYKSDQPKKMHNIVIYAGDAHSQRYRRLLNSLGFFIEVEKTGQSDNTQISCIDMIDIQQPFFSKTFNSSVIPPTRQYNFDYSYTY